MEQFCDLFPFGSVDSVGFEDDSLLFLGPFGFVDFGVKVIIPSELEGGYLYLICLEVRD